MTERQCKLDHQRKERDPGNAFDVRPNPCHAGTRPTSKGLRIKPLSSCRNFAKLVDRCQQRCIHVSPDFGRLWDFGNASRYWRRQRDQPDCAPEACEHRSEGRCVNVSGRPTSQRD
jgi:hypothetical protein